MKMIASLIVLGLVGCGSKKDSKTDASVEAPVVSNQAADVAGVYATLNDQLTSLHVTTYGLRAMKLADAQWTADDWGAARFNCFGTCEGSLSGKDYVNASLDSSNDQSPAGLVIRKLSVFCYIGAILNSDQIDANGLPIPQAAKTVTFDDDMKSRLSANCDASDAQVTEISSAAPTLTIEAVTGGNFDSLVTLNIGTGVDAEVLPFYMKNSGGIISVGSFETTKDSQNNPGITRTLFKLNVATHDFQFENYSNVPPTGAGDTTATAGSMSFTRGYRNSETNEVRFLSDMGNANYTLNHTFLLFSGNENQAQAGAYLSRTAADNTALEGTFVCFDRANGDFINNSGCTENADQTRKQEWNSTTALFTTIHSKANADWELSKTTDVADFNATTITTLAPNFK